MAGKGFRHRVEYALLRLTVWKLSLLPLRAALGVGAALGWIAWKLLRVRREVSMINLRQAFPERRDEELARTGLHSYMNAGRFMVEFARQAGFDDDHLRRHVELDGGSEGILEEALALERGLIGLSFHFGNWELLGVAQRRLGFDVHFLVGRQKNTLVDDYINGLRSSHGLEIIKRDAAMRRIVRISREGGIVCWLSDQDAGSSGLVVDFFGYPASTPRGAAAFSVKLGMPILVGFMVRRNGPFHRLVFTGLLRPRKDLSKEEAELELTQRYTSLLEDMVRQHPEQYWWPHRRWMTTGLYRGGGQTDTGTRGNR
jgi:KDO2-lipid IV(A) lauroyltransferase